MPIHRPRLHIVSYDITDPKRLNQVHRYLVKQGIPLQYSVFLVLIAPLGLRSLMQEIDALIDPRKDDVRAYPLPQRLDYIHLGRQLFPEGVKLVGENLPLDLFRQAA
jgi:CRISPR-associated protein Cas2